MGVSENGGTYYDTLNGRILYYGDTEIRYPYTSETPKSVCPGAFSGLLALQSLDISKISLKDGLGFRSFRV